MTPPPSPGRSARDGGRRPRRRRDGGYTMVVVVVAIAILNVLLATAIPSWSTALQREKEEELIFRGLQYAEAIRVFEQRFGRKPVTLEELLEVEPRSIRRLWEDPMTEDGEWGLIFATQQGTQGGGEDLAGGGGPGEDEDGRRRPGPGDDDGGDGEDDDGHESLLDDLPGSGDEVTVGPIAGVYSKSEEESIKIFVDADRYNEWRFTVELLTGATTAQAPDPEGPDPQNPQNPAGGGSQVGQPGLPRVLATRWIGRPLPDNLRQAMGGPVGGSAPGSPVGPAGGGPASGGDGEDQPGTELAPGGGGQGDHSPE